MGAKITEVPELVKAANPVTYIRENTPPFLIQHGVNDPVVPVQHSIELADVLKDACGEDKVRLDLIDGAEHGDPKFASPLNVKKVLDYLDHQLI